MQSVRDTETENQREKYFTFLAKFSISIVKSIVKLHVTNEMDVVGKHRIIILLHMANASFNQNKV